MNTKITNNRKKGCIKQQWVSPQNLPNFEHADKPVIEHISSMHSENAFIMAEPKTMMQYFVNTLKSKQTTKITQAPLSTQAVIIRKQRLT